jgi:hypothetical protein
VESGTRLGEGHLTMLAAVSGEEKEAILKADG